MAITVTLIRSRDPLPDTGLPCAWAQGMMTSSGEQVVNGTDLGWEQCVLGRNAFGHCIPVFLYFGSEAILVYQRFEIFPSLNILIL